MTALLESDSDFEMVPGSRHGSWEPFDDAEDALDHVRDGIAALETRIGLADGEVAPVAGILYRAAALLADHNRQQMSEVLLGILPSRNHRNLRRDQ